MLALMFQAGEEKFSIDTKEVIEIIPIVKIEKLPTAPEVIRGMINYRGKFIPLFDLGILLGFNESILALSTRIIVTEIQLDQKKETIAFLAEKATDIAEINPEAASHVELNLPNLPYLKRVAKYGNSILRHLELPLFINDNLKEFLVRERKD